MTKKTGATPDMRREYKKEFRQLELQVRTHNRAANRRVASLVREIRKIRASAKRFQTQSHILSERQVAALQRKEKAAAKASLKAIDKLQDRQAILLGRLS